MRKKIAHLLVFGIFLNIAHADLLTMALRSYDGQGGDLSIVITDNGLFDSDPALDSLCYSGSIGGISGAFTGTGTKLNGMPTLSFSGELLNVGEAGLSGYLYFGGLTDVALDLPLARDSISISSSDVLNFTHLSYAGGSSGLDFGTSGNRLTRQSANGGSSYEGIANGDLTGALSSLSQTINIATGANSATSFMATVEAVRVPEYVNTSSLLAISGLMFVWLSKVHRKG